ncbi:MAG: copper chaperone PCu(A)C [Actinocrinis sp.]
MSRRHRVRARLIAPPAALCALLSACSQPSAAPSGQQTPARITVTAAVIVKPTSPGTAAPLYFVVDNPTASSDRILSVSTAAAARTLINDNLGGAGGASGIDVPAHTTTALSPFGSDVLLLNPAPLAPGAAVELTVEFKIHGRITISATVETVAQAAARLTSAP